MDAREIQRRCKKLKSERANWDDTWEEVSRLMMPRAKSFLGGNVTKGDKRQYHIVDSTAQLSLERFAATLEANLTPRQHKWHKLRAMEEAMNDVYEVQAWMEATTDILFKIRNRPTAGFASQTYENYMNLGAFGNSVLFVDEQEGLPRYYSIHLSDVVFEQDYAGKVDTVYRTIEMTRRQARQQFDNVPSEWDTDRKRDDDKVCVIHAVYPREPDAVVRTSLVGTQMPYVSKYVLEDKDFTFFEGGYGTMPYGISRYQVAFKETYGRSIGMMVLPEVRMLQEMRTTQIKLAHKLSNPPLLTADQGMLGMGNRRLNSVPGGINPGGVNAQGQQMVVPMQFGAQPEYLTAMLEEARHIIREAFLLNLFQILVETPEMTATEAMIRAQEKGQLLAPALGRQQAEMWVPVIEREIEILDRNGLLPERPEIMQDPTFEYEVVFDAPVNRMQDSPEVVGLQQAIASTAPLIETDPSLLDNYDQDYIFREVNRISGVPALFMRAPEQVAEMRQQRAEQEAQQQQAMMAPMEASAVKDAASAVATLSEEQ